MDDKQIAKPERRHSGREVAVKRTETTTSRPTVRAVAASGALCLSAVLLSGCMGSPTYGTDKTADQQLIEDVTGVLSLGPRDREKIEYKPRAGIVMPSSTEVLPPPQENVASTSNPAWPESPEERLARIRAEATENQDNRFYKSPVERDIGVNARSDDGFINPEVAKKQREEYFKRRAASVSAQGTPTQRRYLSEPPTTYRQPAETAPTGVLGDDEAKKAREAKKAAQKGGGGFDLGRLWPWGG